MYAKVYTSDVPTKKFGEALRAQVEERLNFFEVSWLIPYRRCIDAPSLSCSEADYQTGAPVSKNADAIQKALTAIAADLDADDDDDEDGDIADEDIKDVSAAISHAGHDKDSR